MVLNPVIIFACVFVGSMLSIAGEPLCSIDEICKIPSFSKTNPIPFAISGQVLSSYHNSRFNVITVTDNQSILAFANTTKTPCRSGDRIRIRGFINRNPEFGDNGIFADFLEVIGNEPLPETAEGISPIGHHKPFGKLQGVISQIVQDEMDANYNWIVLRTPFGDLCASATESEYPYTNLVQLIDAEVVLKGSIARGPNLRKPGSLNLFLFGTEGIQVTLPPPSDPFSSPPLGSEPLLHRQCVSGSVIAIGHNLILVRLNDGRFLQTSVADTVNDLRPGDRITAVGFIKADTYALWLGGALLRRDEGQEKQHEIPQDISHTELLSTRQKEYSKINVALHGKTVRIKGVLNSSQSELKYSETMRLEFNHCTFEVDTFSLSPEMIETLERGMTLSVTGTCLVQFKADNVTSSLPSFHRFLIVPRSSDDIAILTTPPWWTATKLLFVIALLAIVILAVLLWNRSLRILSERRGHELSLALTARVKAESRTQERTRLALELHDSISQTLTGVALQIDAATTSVQIESERRNAYLTTAKYLLASCRKALQDCLWDLRSRTFEEKNLTEAISRTLAPFLNKCTILVRFNVPREALSESTTHAILSIIRELTANAIRHGNASHIRIAGELSDGNVRFSVTDNGCGFNPEQAPGPHDGHFGLQGIRERINDFNGTVSLMSTPGTGTKVTASLALDPSDTHHEEKHA